MKSKLIYILILVIGINGCSLDEAIYDTPMSETFIKNKDDVPFLINGVYSLLTTWNLYKNGAMNLTLYSGDDYASSSVTSSSAGVFLGRHFNASNVYISNGWTGYYQLISNSNALMKALRNTDVIDQAYKDRLMGEMCFMRAFAYFNLVRLFGEVPLRKEVSTGSTDFYPKKSSVKEVYEFIFSDLIQANELCLPFSAQPPTEFGRATKGAAQAMLSLAYLTYGNYCDLSGNTENVKEYYTKASQYADSVILSNEYTLVNNYADLWDVSKEKDAYKEVIFGIQFTRDGLSAGASSRGSEFAYYQQPAARYDICGNLPDGNGAGQARIQPWFYDKYTSGDFTGDYRCEITFLTSWYSRLKKATYVTYPLIPKAGEKNETQPYLDKYRDPDGYQNRNNENDYYIIRLSEIYLIKAEAENELNGPTGIAYAAFNKLRERARKANGTPRMVPKDLAAGLTKEEFRMKVFDERALELVGEGHRWFDLVRTKYYNTNKTMIEYQFNEFLPKQAPYALPKYNTSKKIWEGGRIQPLSVSPWSERYLLFPIPGAETDANKNVTQNTGW